MSLENKLSKLSNKVREDNENKSKKDQEERLEPIRLKIKAIEKIRFEHELILESLRLKTDKDTGVGMREYSEGVKNEFKRKDTQLEELVSKHKEALEAIGVENKDQLLENPDFLEDEEIVNFKKAKEQKENLELSNESLKEKLLSLGMTFDKENFSYDLAEKILQEKIEQIKKELALEKAKTPEGKEELKQELIEYFNKKIARPYLDLGRKYQGDYFLEFGNGRKINFDNGRIIKGNNPIDFYGKEWKDIEEKYPYDVIREAMSKSLEEKVEHPSYYSDRINYEQFKKRIQPEILQKVKDMIDFRLRCGELAYKSKKEGLGERFKSIENFGFSIKRLELDKQEAESALMQIAKFEDELPDEKVILEGIRIDIPSVIKKHDEFTEEIKEKRKRLQDILSEIRGLEYNKPKIFGKEKWSNKIDELKREKVELEKRTDKDFVKDENDKLYSKSYFFIKIKDDYDSEVRNVIQKQPKTEGYPKEIFGDLKSKLNDIIKSETLETAKKLYHEFNDLLENHQKIPYY